MGSVVAWLREVGLEQYVPAFEANGVDEQTLRSLTDADLVELGIRSVGHRRKLIAAIEALGERPIALAAAPAEAERRQISVLYCDMVGSTELAQRLDAEDYRDVIRAFHGHCLRAVAEYDGQAANFFGDRILAYFGWPHAHEDDAERAVRAALALTRRVAGSGMAVRAGIATGAVVVGDLIREGPAQEQSAVGVPPNLAARLVALAQPGQVVTDVLTQRLLGAAFIVQPLGEHVLKGLAQPVAACAVLGEQAAETRFDARVRALAPMVGREQELALLMQRWQQAQAGNGQAVLLTGEAGIGKSRMVRALLDACTAQMHLVRWQCSPHHTGSALWPVIQRLSRAMGLQSEDTNETALDKLEARISERNAAALYATLLGLNGAQRYGPLEMTPQMAREQTLELLVEQLVEMAEQRPLLLVVEDVHWLDPTSMELIERCLERLGETRLLVLMTSRPDNQPALAAHPDVTCLSLSRLGHSSVEAIARHLAHGSLKLQTLAKVVARSDGVPLFVEELTKAVMETGEAAIPASLRGSLVSRLDRIPEAKEIAQMAAAIGREFDEELVQAVADRPGSVRPALDRLIEAELVYRHGRTPGARYRFKHALVQQAVHESLLSNRREALHARILDVLERCRPATPKEVLAHHATAAGALDRAAVLWLEAGRVAQAQGALAEACTLLENAIDLICKQPDTAERRALELEMQSRLGICRTGIPEASGDPAREAFDRANELAKLGATEPLPRLWAQFGLWNWHHSHGDLTKALQLGSEALVTAETEGLPETLHAAQRMVAATHLYLGDLAHAQEGHERALSLWESDSRLATSANRLQHVGTLMQYGFLRCIQGRFDDSRRLMRCALEQCTPLTPVHQRRYLHLLTAIQAALLRDPARARAELSAASELTTRHGMPTWIEGYGNVLTAWISMESGQLTDDAIASQAHGIEKLEASGVRLLLPLFMTWLATALSLRGRLDEARQAIDRASTLCADTNQGWCEAEIWRVGGELHLRAEPPGIHQAVRCFRRALVLARAQGAGLWELRTAVSLAEARTLRRAASRREGRPA